MMQPDSDVRQVSYVNQPLPPLVVSTNVCPTYRLPSGTRRRTLQVLPPFDVTAKYTVLVTPSTPDMMPERADQNEMAAGRKPFGTVDIPDGAAVHPPTMQSEHPRSTRSLRNR
jgi:hypothetical protein